MAEHGPRDSRRPSVDPRIIDASGSRSVRLAPLGFEALLNVRGRPDDPDFRDSIAAAAGVALPLVPNTVASGAGRAALWLGPDEWLIVAADGEAPALETAIRTSCADDPWLAVTDVSGNYSAYALIGPAARDVLAKGCPLDLHRRAFGMHRCAQSTLAAARVLLSVGDDPERISIRVRNSYARYLVAWLGDAVLEFAD